MICGQFAMCSKTSRNGMPEIQRGNGNLCTQFGHIEINERPQAQTSARTPKNSGAIPNGWTLTPPTDKSCCRSTPPATRITAQNYCIAVAVAVVVVGVSTVWHAYDRRWLKESGKSIYVCTYIHTYILYVERRTPAACFFLAWKSNMYVRVHVFCVCWHNIKSSEQGRFWKIAPTDFRVEYVMCRSTSINLV